MKRLALMMLVGVFITFYASPGSSQVEQSKGAISKEYVVDVASLARFSPRARADLVAVIVQQWKLAEAAEINSADRVYHFISQMAAETGGLRVIAENMNYSAARLRQVFPTRVTPEQADRLASLGPVAIANHVYNGRLGNRLPNDGWSYRGSGLIQLTGRGNFSSRGQELGLPFEDNPEMVRTPSASFPAAVAYWKARNLNAIADTNDLRKVRISVNGGTNGLAEAGIWLARARRYLRVSGERDPASEAEESVAVERTLRSLGYLGAPRSGERSPPDEIDSAIKRFQRSRGLQESGQVDEDTLYELVDPDNFRTEDR